MTRTSEAKHLRTFGLLVGGLFGLLALWPTLVRSDAPRLWAAGLALSLAIPALVYPRSLRPVYRGWMVLGQVVGRINTRLMLGLILYGLFTPIGFLRRVLLGQDALRRRWEPEAETYRVTRQPRPGSHMNRQF